MAEELCENCGKRPVEYDAPGRWCERCWVRWWADGIVPKKASQKERDQALQETKKHHKEMKKRERSRAKRDVP